MAVDRNLWAKSFRGDLPHWPCPTCRKGYLAASKEKLWIEERGPSKAARDHDAWEPDWIENVFVALFECSMPSCKELAAVSGTAGIYFVQIGYDEYIDDQVFKVESITPAPIPIACPEATPQSIIDAIGRASILVWPSSESAANQIRQAVECLMDDAGVAAANADGMPIMLHHRILKFQKTDAENGDVLLATKWLGNSGSHVGGVSREDVLDAFDMIEFVLENRYGTTKAELMAKVAAVNAAKGPVQQF
jgi:Domain of unknown function (DUF4145)